MGEKNGWDSTIQLGFFVGLCEGKVSEEGEGGREAPTWILVAARFARDFQIYQLDVEIQ